MDAESEIYWALRDSGTSWTSYMWLALTMDMSKIHNVFHVSILRKYIPDPINVLETQPIQTKEDLSYEEESVHILD